MALQGGTVPDDFISLRTTNLKYNFSAYLIQVYANFLQNGTRFLFDRIFFRAVSLRKLLNVYNENLEVGQIQLSLWKIDIFNVSVVHILLRHEVMAATTQI